MCLNPDFSGLLTIGVIYDRGHRERIESSSCKEWGVSVENFNDCSTERESHTFIDWIQSLLLSRSFIVEKKESLSCDKISCPVDKQTLLGTELMK